MEYQVIKEVLEKLEIFNSANEGGDLRSFSFWLYSQFQDEPPNDPPTLAENLDGQLAAHLATASVHLKHYVKTALKDTPLVGMTDFGFLASLMKVESLRKTELITLNYSELSPGIEVIKRLIRFGMAEDFDDPEDGRSRRVRITDRGRELYLAAVGDLIRAARILTGGLAGEEKLRLLRLLEQVNAFHHPIWEQTRSRGLKDVEEWVQSYLHNSNGLP